ncbi:MAG: HEAT repeat domain-containing protein [Phycisphaerae bacterium]
MHSLTNRGGRVATAIVIALTIVALGAAFYAWIWPSLWVERVFTEESIQRLADPATRAEEARRLGEHRIARAVPYIAPILKTDDDADRRAAAWSLSRIATPSALRALEPLVDDPDETLRAQLAGGLARSSADPNQPVVRSLARDEATGVRVALADLLRTAPPGDPLEQLTDTLLSDPSPKVRIAATRALAARGGSAGFGGVARAQQDADPNVAAAADQAIRSQSQRLLPVILQLARSEPSYAERLAALPVLAATEDARGVLPILKLCTAGAGRRGFTHEQLRSLIAASADALAKIGEPAIAPLVRETIDGEYPPPAEEAAARACAEIGAPAAKPVAEAITRWRIFPDAAELGMWVDALGEMRSPAALPALDLALAQGVDGLADRVAAARAKIAESVDTPLPAPNPPGDLLLGEPDANAYGSLYPAGALVTPLKSQANTLPDNGVVRLELPEAIHTNRGGGTTSKHDVAMDLVRRDGKWDRDFLGVSIDFNKRVHDGRITKVSDDGRTLAMQIVYRNDLWRRSAMGEYTVTLSEKSGTLTGSYDGHCNYDKANGPVNVVAYGRDWSKRPTRELKEGLHPRLFFRPEDLPRLRQRARTRFGRRVLGHIRRRLSHGKMLYKTKLDYVTNWQPGVEKAMGHGLLATLFDDERHGRRAAALLMPRTRQYPYIGEHGERLPEPLSMYPWAYDLTHPFLTEDEFREVRETRAWVRMEFTTRLGPGGVFSAHRAVLAIPALGCLSLLEEQATYFTMDRYREPPKVMDFPAATDLKVAKDVPLNDIQAGKPIGHWLVAGPMPRGAKKEPVAAGPLADLGGPAKADITPGTRIRYAGKGYVFGRLGSEPTREIAGIKTGRHVLVLPTQPEGRRYLLYSVLQAEKEVAFQLPARRQFGDMRSAVYIDGQRVPLGTVVVLAKGVHRILIDAVGPLVSVEYPGVDAGYARANHRKYEWLQAQWETAKTRYRRTGKFQSLPYILKRCDAAVREQVRHQMSQVAKGKKYKSAKWVWPYVAARWVAQGQGMYPDTPMATLTGNVPPDKLPDRELVFSLAYAPPSHRAALKTEFDRRFASGNLGRLGMLELIAAFVHNPLSN